MNSEYTRGAVYWIAMDKEPEGSLQRGNRPAVIISNDFNNRYSTNVTVVPITSQHKKLLPVHVLIRSVSGHQEQNTILCEQITTVPKTKLGNFQLMLPKYVMDKVDKALAIQLGIAQPPTQQETLNNTSKKPVLKSYSDNDKLQFLTDAKTLTDAQLAEKYNMTANAVRTYKISWLTHFKNKS